MIVGIYIRVSTEEQAQHGYSIDAQKEKMIAYCQSQGWMEYKLYIDDGYTGTNMNRPALNRLIRHVKTNKINLIVVYKLDRLSRKQSDVLYLLEELLEKNNVGFKSATEPFETTTPFGKAMIGILAVFAQLERDMIIERMSTGRKQRIKEGQWCGGRIPFGYYWDKESQKLIIIPEEARIIKEIFKKYIDGESRLAIAEWAAARCTSRVIDHSVVRNMLSRHVYLGVLNNSGTYVKGNHEPIINQKTWDAAQNESLKRKNGVTPKGEFLLTGLLKCGVCRGNIVHVKRRTKRNGKNYCYELYACKNQHVRVKERNNTCSLGYQKRKTVEQFVVNQLKELSLFPEKIENARSVMRCDDNNSIPTTIATLQNKLKKISTSLENLYDAIQEGEIKASSVSNRIQILEEQREIIETNIEDMQESTLIQDNTDEIYSIIKNVGTAWEYFTEEEQKTVIRKVIKSIILQKKEAPVIELNFA